MDEREPRRLPIPALLMLGRMGGHSGALAFLRSAKELGFGLDQPGDHDLSEEKWQEVAMLRVSALVSAFEHSHG